MNKEWPLPGVGLASASQGAFGSPRRFDVHTGIDLYCKDGQPVVAIESGQVVVVVRFTGAAAGSPWWHDTDAVMVEGPSGVILYGEILPVVKVGDWVAAEEMLGTVLTVLKNDKGLPMTMLHLELYKHGTREPVEWRLGEPQPECLLDPATLLRSEG